MSPTNWRRPWAAADLARIGDLTVADLIARPFDGLALTCRACGRSGCLPFRLLCERRLAQPADLVIDVFARLRCETCGTPPAYLSDAAPWTVWDAQPDAAVEARPPPELES